MHSKSRALDFMSIIKLSKKKAILVGRKNKIAFAARAFETKGKRTITPLVQKNDHVKLKNLEKWGLSKLSSTGLFTIDPYPYFSERKAISLLWEYCHNINLISGEVTISPGFSINMNKIFKTYSEHFKMWMQNMYNKASSEKLKMPKQIEYDYFAAFLNRANPNELGHWPEEYKIS